jgi:CO/xanthine dehydrogenase Mo-binding subunit
VVARIESGVAVGVAMALFEELPPNDVPGAGFGYPSPTLLDQPSAQVALVAEASLADGGEIAAEPPFGVKPVGDLAVIGTAPAVLAAIRDAGVAGCFAVPVRPTHVVAGLSQPAGQPEG